MPVELRADESVDGRLINCVLLTEDSDFGEWVFAHREPSTGVVFLRYRRTERNQVSSTVLELVGRHGRGLYRKFTTVTPRKTRMRVI